LLGRATRRGVTDFGPGPGRPARRPASPDRSPRGSAPGSVPALPRHRDEEVALVAAEDLDRARAQDGEPVRGEEEAARVGCGAARNLGERAHVPDVHAAVVVEERDAIAASAICSRTRRRSGLKTPPPSRRPRTPRMSSRFAIAWRL